MSSRGLASLLAMPPSLRPVILQAALSPSSILSCPTTPLSQTRSYAKRATPSKTRRTASPIPPKKKKTAASRPSVSTKAKPAPAATKKATTSIRPTATSTSTATSTTTSSSTTPDVELHNQPPRTFSYLPTPASTITGSAVLADPPLDADITRSSNLFRHPKFLYSAPRFLNLPFNTRIPEICILGRSNVGKSTLINALAGYGGKKAGTAHGGSASRKGIAITSAKAGCTKTMNAYGFGPPASVKPLTKEEQERNKEGGRGRSERRKKGTGSFKPEGMPKHSLIMMDMPGYGMNSRADWGDEILKYINRRDILSGAVLLVDAVAGLKDGDRMVLDVLREAGLRTSVVLTKADKLVTEPDLHLWQTSTTLREACSHVFQELRQIEKQGESQWFEGDGWTPEIFVTGAGDPKMGGMGIDGARVAICRLAGLVAEPSRMVHVQQPEIVPFDQLVFTAPKVMPKYKIESKPVDKTRGVETAGRGRTRPRTSEKVFDPIRAMEQQIMRAPRLKDLGRASF
ncbi:P-loop containing nucleoside triphosphate hydrolase protein [Coniella lustricola]|uniref:P-loop containing nucleoside triphosphate hydrolase protein n=1 Tax=Coniella lustricola TaxID=2025994 RepID=A0A2T3AM14_9PEZI|nr:P-loop containing nucleoside triphosphate hydrolase protein [Coniella lustricola]